MQNSSIKNEKSPKKPLTNGGGCGIISTLRGQKHAGMAELADALDSGSSESNFMEVQVLLPAYDPDPLGSDFFMWMFL